MRKVFYAAAISDVAVQAIVDVLLDPAHPLNQLKRPARRQCAHCQESYRSSVAYGLDGFCCSEACRAAYRQTQMELVASLQKELNRLFPAPTQ